MTKRDAHIQALLVALVKEEYENDQQVIVAKKIIREMRELAYNYKNIVIEKPYIEKLETKFKEKFPVTPRAMRAFPQLIGIIEAITLLNHNNRSKTECEDATLKITSIIQDGETALEILDYFLEGLKYGVSSRMGILWVIPPFKSK